MNNAAIQYGHRLYRVGQYVHAVNLAANGKIVDIDSGKVSGLDNCTPVASVNIGGQIKRIALSYLKHGWVLR